MILNQCVFHHYYLNQYGFFCDNNLKSKYSKLNNFDNFFKTTDEDISSGELVERPSGDEGEVNEEHEEDEEDEGSNSEEEGSEEEESEEQSSDEENENEKATDKNAVNDVTEKIVDNIIEEAVIKLL